MGFSINEILAHINKNYFAKPNYYTVQIFGGNVQIDAPEDVTFNCAAISVPGINLGVVPDKRSGIGLFTNYPNGKSFTEITATFYESEFESERKYFVEWVNKIFDPKTGRMEFYDQYNKTVIINQYNRKDQLVYRAKMLNAWPSNISALDRGYNMGDSPAQLTVGLQFFQLEEEFFTAGSPDKEGNIRNTPVRKEDIIWNDIKIQQKPTKPTTENT